MSQANLSTRRAWLLFAGFAALDLVWLQWLSADVTFTSDDWLILSRRSLDLAPLLTPFNEHLSLVPITSMLLLRDTVGIGPHWLYLLAVQLAHVATAAGVLMIALRYRSPVVALVLSGLALVTGPATANLLWAFQLGAVVATAAGVWALDLVDMGRRPWLAAVLCGVAVASSSFGLAFAIAAGSLAIVRSERPAVVGIGLVGAAYVAWYVMFHSGSAPLCAPTGLGPLALQAGPFLFAGLTYAVGMPLGIGLATQPLVGLAAAAGAGWLVTLTLALRRGNRPWLALAAVGAIALVAVLIAWGRGCLGPQVAGAPRYVYAMGMLALIGIASSPWPRLGGSDVRPTAWVAVALLTVGVVLTLHLRSSLDAHESYLGTSRAIRAAVSMRLGPDGGHCEVKPLPVDSLSSTVGYVPPRAWLETWLGSAARLDPPPWVGTNWRPPAELSTKVRQLICTGAIAPKGASQDGPH